MGVKQGDPLSPLLFGLFIDRFEKFVASECPDIGAHMLDHLVQVLLYADDLVLFAESPADLQKLLNALHLFCIHNSMTVNIKKSEAVVFNNKFSLRNASLAYDGSQLEIKPSFIYLGMLFDEADGMKGAGRRCINKGRAALYAMVRRCHELDIHNVYIKCHLFDSLVKPILTYGCEIWGPCLLAKGASLTESSFSKELEAIHKGCGNVWVSVNQQLTWCSSVS